MAVNYTRLAATALRLLQSYGREVTLVKKSRTPADPMMPWKGSDKRVDTTVIVTAAFMDPVSEKNLGREIRRGNEENSDNLSRGNQSAFFSPQENLDSNGDPVDLLLFDRMLDNGLVYTIDFIRVLKPGPIALLYQATVVR